MSGWSTPAGEVRVEETGLCIEGEYLPDKKPTTEGTTHE